MSSDSPQFAEIIKAALDAPITLAGDGLSGLPPAVMEALQSLADPGADAPRRVVRSRLRRLESEVERIAAHRDFDPRVRSKS